MKSVVMISGGGRGLGAAITQKLLAKAGRYRSACATKTQG
jgi:NAD(P)-dependent dehydrogenase (short-subunit alcohol dehydrogenase family)